MDARYTLHVDGVPIWGTSSQFFVDCVRQSLMHFGFPQREINDARNGDSDILARWEDYRNLHSQKLHIFKARPVRGGGKSEPEPERKLIGYRMGKYDKVYPLHIFTPVYEEPKSTYVTRASAEQAITQAGWDAIHGRSGWLQRSLDMLEPKPKVRAKAGSE